MTTIVERGLRPVRRELGNGAVAIAQQTSMTPAVTISAAFRAGSLYDPVDLPGLAYQTARVIDRGTERRSASTIAEELDDRGVAIRVSANRHTMALTCTCLAEDFEDILDVILDIARRPVFPEEEVAKRRLETITALRQDEDNPAVRAPQALMSLLYGATHPYGRPPKGTVASMERISRRDLQAFHLERVRPSVLSLVIVGDIEPSHALDRVAMEIEGWNGAVAIPREVPPPAASAGRRQATIPMPGKSQTDIAYGFTAVRRLDPRYYAYWMMNNVFGQFGLGGRLAENIRERQGMAYYAFSTFDPSPAPAPLIVRAGVDPANVERAITAIDHEVRTLAADGPTPREVEETREYLVGSIPRMLETNQSIASFLQTSEEFGLGMDFDQRLPALLRAVTFEEVRTAAAEALNPDRAALAVAGPPTNGDPPGA